MVQVRPSKKALDPNARTEKASEPPVVPHNYQAVMGALPSASNHGLVMARMILAGREEPENPLIRMAATRNLM